MPYGLSSVPEGDQDSSEGLLIRYRWLLAFSWLAKQNPSYQRTLSRARARARSFDPVVVSSARKPRLKLTVEGSGYCAHISSPADSRRSFLPLCLFIAGFNVTRVISDYIFVCWKTPQDNVNIIKLDVTIEYIIPIKTSPVLLYKVILGAYSYIT